MKQASNNTGIVRLARIAVACAAFATLVACGGSDNNNNNASSTPAGGVKLQVVSFGDSLSDAGTYTPVIAANFGGGRFTTNPGEVWTQKVAEYYGDTLTPAYVGGFGQPLKANGGFGYAQGGSDVANPAGIGFAPNNMAATTVPVASQVKQYLTDHGSFNSNQLVLINGGANDILQLLQNTQFMTNLQTQLATATTVQQQQLIIGTAVGTQLQTAIASFVGLVGTTLSNGATHVVVIDVPDIGLTPLATGEAAANNAPQLPALITGIVSAYNTLVANGLATAGIDTKVIKVSSFNWLHQLLGSYQSQGFTNATGTACNITQMEQNATAYATANPSVLVGGMTAQQYGQQFGSSLFCSPQTLTVAGADQSYVFADQLHPTTHAYAAFATFVEQQIAATGLGK
ncbi:SGNH/GDSL hydrolase family protein [Paraburkholderia diazotrophica]|uniref:Phospholipase/lecithinase/hemolysin n=1 Tax=Paraburkholderia diazotrophica TaxID=667676 RepID=A0A1H6X688_9BURK|nr:SGNH/GDSL hydrolase family protein [Paraburkholderia diazotrophica]SEJ24679.1 Phospholipase/lecithinase/hemolysin [Paraburkholderia diazotrophica]